MSKSLGTPDSKPASIWAKAADLYFRRERLTTALAATAAAGISSWALASGSLWGSVPETLGAIATATAFVPFFHYSQSTLNPKTKAGRIADRALMHVVVAPMLATFVGAVSTGLAAHTSQVIFGKVHPRLGTTYMSKDAVNNLERSCFNDPTWNYTDKNGRTYQAELTEPIHTIETVIDGKVVESSRKLSVEVLYSWQDVLAGTQLAKVHMSFYQPSSLCPQPQG